ncbi:dentin sialophosphoprotein isoform X2 [Drosophila suzukii]|uniref:Dentin sialophosphoprotein isoform X2 n=1 Tax=Drosophila suzukii TaxID=28584 RepID=A0AB40DD05_DROSZ
MDDFIKTLIAEVKSQGVFDEFRFNCCLADVDTKPAYQNVRNRVEAAVNDFLAKQQWTPETNKVQLRERLRKHLLDSDVLDKGVDQIVDQVVNPKVATIFEPKIESIVYKYLGITPPPPPPPRPTMLPAPPLPPFAGHMNGSGSSLLNVETTAGLLPTDLEQISPDSDRATVKSDLKDDELPPGVDDEDTSPSYEMVNEEKPLVSKEELNNGSLNNSDSVNGVSQASQLSQVSSDSRLTIASSTESVTDAQQPTTALNSGNPANISEEAQMPKFSENSSDASAGAGENGNRQLHFDIKQDAITFEGTERKNSVSEDTNGGPGILSIEDAIMSEVKANIDDANNASIESIVEPESVQPPAPTSIEPPPPAPPLEPPPAPQPVEPPPPPPPEVVPPPPPAEVVPPPPSEPSTFEPPPPPAPLKVEPPPTPQPAENSNGSGSVTVLTVTPKETENSDVEPNAVDAEVKEEDKPTATVEVKEDKPLELAPPQEVETPKEEVTKSSESTASPISVSSQSKSHSKSKNREKERRHHSHSDDKQRRRSRSRDRDRDRDRDRSRDKSHTKHSSSSSSKHSSSHSSSSKHRSSSSKNDKNTSSSSSRSNHESSSSKRSATSSSSRHESSSHKKHKSSSSSSRSDRDKDKEREKDQSRSHHSSSSSSSSSKRKDHDRGRDRDRNKSNSSGSAETKAIQDDHNESKAKPIQRRSSDSNDEGKPPSSGGPAKISQPEVTSATEKPDAPVENGNGTNGNSNGSSNGVSDSAVSASSVIIVSDILQQSSTSFIQLTAGSQSHKVVEESKPEPEDIDGKKADNQPEKPESVDSASQDEAPSVEPQKADVAESVPDSTVEDSKEGDVLETEPVETNEKEKTLAEESIPENPVDIVETTSQLEELPKDDETPATQFPGSNEQSDELVADFVTHFEENTDEFKARLQLISQLIEDRKNLLNRLSADGSQDEAVDVRALRRSISKRRRSSLQEQHVVRESTPARLCSPSSSTSGSPAKRLRRDEPKSSPTPSDASINSKENEALEKQEHAV